MTEEKWKSGTCEHIEAFLAYLEEQEKHGIFLHCQDPMEVQCHIHHFYKVIS